MLDPKDGGYSSRKLWYAIGTSATIFVGAILSGKWALFGPHYETMISGLIGVLALYSGANVGNKYIIGKHLPKLNAQPSEDESDSDADPDADADPKKNKDLPDGEA